MVGADDRTDNQECSLIGGGQTLPLAPFRPEATDFLIM